MHTGYKYNGKDTIKNASKQECYGTKCGQIDFCQKIEDRNNLLFFVRLKRSKYLFNIFIQNLSV